MIPLYDDNPTRTTPFVTFAIIAANVAVFAFQVSTGDQFGRIIWQYGAIPAEIVNFVDLQPHSALPVQANLFTSMFMHADYMHLGGNLLYLWIFGNNIEDVMGHWRFVGFYLLCGLIAVGAHIVQYYDSTVPLVGASGAIAGMLGAYLLAFPRARIYTFFWFIIFIRIIPLPAWLIIGVWFLMQVANLGAGDSVAWGAHLGGFIAGLALLPFFNRRKLWFGRLSS